MKICDTVWRDVQDEYYQLENHPYEQILVKTDITLRICQAKDIDLQTYDIHCFREKALKFAFIGGY